MALRSKEDAYISFNGGNSPSATDMTNTIHDRSNDVTHDDATNSAAGSTADMDALTVIAFPSHVSTHILNEESAVKSLSPKLLRQNKPVVILNDLEKLTYNTNSTTLPFGTILDATSLRSPTTVSQLSKPTTAIYHEHITSLRSIADTPACYIWKKNGNVDNIYQHSFIRTQDIEEELEKKQMPSTSGVSNDISSEILDGIVNGVLASSTTSVTGKKCLQTQCSDNYHEHKSENN